MDNKVYLDKNGHVYVNGNEIKGVKSVVVETDYMGSYIVLKFRGDYKSDYLSKVKEHPLTECSME